MTYTVFYSTFANAMAFFFCDAYTYRLRQIKRVLYHAKALPNAYYNTTTVINCLI